MRPLIWARFGQWDKILSLTPSDLDYRADGMMMPRGAEPYNQAVYRYARALALAGKAGKAGREGRWAGTGGWPRQDGWQGLVGWQGLAVRLLFFAVSAQATDIREVAVGWQVAPLC